MPDWVCRSELDEPLARRRPSATVTASAPASSRRTLQSPVSRMCSPRGRAETRSSPFSCTALSSLPATATRPFPSQRAVSAGPLMPLASATGVSQRATRSRTERELQDGAVDRRTGNDAARAGVDRKDGHPWVAAAAIDVREDPVGAHPCQCCCGPAQRNATPERSRTRGREETERVVVPLGPPPDGESEEAAVGGEGPGTAVALQGERPSGALERDRVETYERGALLARHHPELDGLRRCGELEGSRPRRRHERDEHEHARAGQATDAETAHVPHTPSARRAFPGSAYSTVTVLARFRGWSTFRPRSRAMRYASSCNGSTARTACKKAGVRGT